jgi:hypothetical protein
VQQWRKNAITGKWIEMHVIEPLKRRRKRTGWAQFRAQNRNGGRKLEAFNRRNSMIPR